MKVRAVKTFLVDPGSHKHWLFVKVETDKAHEPVTAGRREGV